MTPLLPDAFLRDAAPQGDVTRVNSLLTRQYAQRWDTALIEATRSKNFDAVRALLRSGVNVDLTNPFGVTALMIAAELGHTEIARMLIKNRANVNHVDNFGLSPLILAASNGHVELVQSLINYGANFEQPCHSPPMDAVGQALIAGHNELVRFLTEFGTRNMDLVTYFDSVGSTALMIAIRRGHLDVVRLLIETGMKTDFTNPSFVSGLVFAAKTGQVDIVRFLIGQGAPINYGSEALHVAAAHGHTEIVNLLLTFGADVHQADVWEWSPLLYAAEKGHLDVCRLLIQHGAHVDDVNGQGFTSLWLAIHNNHIDVVNLLLQHGASLDLANHDGNTALSLAAKQGHIDIVRFEYGAGENQGNIFGRPALLEAACNGFTEIVLLLLEKGANVNHADNTGIPALHLAAANGHTEVVNLLLTFGADIHLEDVWGLTSLFPAIIRNHLDVVKLLLQHGASLDHANHGGRTALSLAANEGHIDIVRLLFEYGANVNQVGGNGITALLDAAQEGFTDIVLLLLENGANVNAVTKYPTTALIAAAESGYTDIVDHLLRFGADVHSVDFWGETALIAAAEDDLSDVCQLLIQAGANIEQQSDEGTVLITALDYKSHSVVELLIEHGVDVNNGSVTTPPRTPLDSALERQSLDAVRILILAGAETSDHQDAPLVQEILGPLDAVEAALTSMESPMKAFVGLASSQILGVELLITFAYKAHSVTSVDILSDSEIQAYFEHAGWRHVSIESLRAIIHGLSTLQCSDVHVHYIVGPFIARAYSRSIERLLRAIRFLANDVPSSTTSLFNAMIGRSSTVGLGPVIDAIYAIMEKRALHVGALSKVESKGGLKLQPDMTILIHRFLQGSVVDSLQRDAMRELAKAIDNHYVNLSKRSLKRSREEGPWMTTIPPKRTAGASEDESS